MLLVCLLALFVTHAWGQIDLTVVTSKGPVKGQRDTDGGHTNFYGIPYAKVDEANPFGRSKEYPDFKVKFEASDSTVKCPQIDRILKTPTGILQCLRLNIQVPHSAANNTLPVLVWFHGGGFSFGTGADFDGKYLVQHDIIVVTVNYRLGPYGFLCLDDATVPGNQGLKDQIAALKWIKENIDAFGGDANKITIAGESSGAGAVDLHLYSKFSTLFDKAILQSGSMFVQGMFVKADHEAAIKLAKALGHYTPNTKDALKFLGNSTPLEVINAFNNISLELRPCREKRFKGVINFVRDDPFHLHRLKPSKILIGYNSKEDFGGLVSQTDEYFATLGSLFFDTLKKSFDLQYYDLERLVKIVHRFYLGSKPISKATMLEIIDFLSDFKMNRGVELSVGKYLRHGATEIYKYLFSYVGGSKYVNITGVGASHTDELKYLFNMEPLTDSEQKFMKDRMTTMWTNFVKFGNPTPKAEPVQWTPINPSNDTRPYLNIDVNMEIKDSVYKERIAFWDLFDNAYWDQSTIIQRKH